MPGGGILLRSPRSNQKFKCRLLISHGMSQLLVMVKPWSINHADNILAELDEHGTRLKTTKVGKIKLEDIAEHYAQHSQRDNYQDMVHDFAGLPAVLALYDGDFDEFDALKRKIRTKYASDIPFNPNHQRNALHTSGSQQEFLHEIGIWQAYLT